VPNCQVYS